MMLGKINALEIKCFRLDQKWTASLPETGWLLLVITNEMQPLLFSSLVEICMDKNPLYICIIGQNASVLEDWFDEEIVVRALVWEEKYEAKFDYDTSPMTTAHTSLNEGFWFATSVVPLSNAAIKTIFCLDLTNECLGRIQELIPLINAGWLPPDE